jgi:hypothetical protein
MFSFLEITDGTVATACELTNGVDYALVSYAPGVAPLRDSLLGGAGPYQEVTDTITVHAMGTTAALAYAAAEKLNTLLDQARRWWDGERVTAVQIRATAQDSTITSPLVALVRGRARAAPPSLTLPPVWSELFGKYVVQHIQLQFVRGPTWFGATQTATSGSSAMPAILSATFAAGGVNTFSPTVVTLTGPLVRAVLSLQVGYLIVAPQNRIVVIEGEAMTKTGTGTATVTADAAAHASGGNVMRMSAAPAQLQLESTFAAPFAANAYQVAVFAAIRVNGTPTNPISMWTLLFRNAFFTSGPIVPIDYTFFGVPNYPQIVFLGIIDTPSPFTKVMIVTSWLDNPVTIDLDYVVCVALNNAPDARVVATVIDPNSYTPFTGAAAASAVTVTYDPKNLSEVAARVTGSEASGGTDEPWSIVGDPFLVTKEAIMTGMWLSTDGAFWRPWDTTLAAAISFTLAYSRRAPYVVPQ